MELIQEIVLLIGARGFIASANQTYVNEKQLKSVSENIYNILLAVALVLMVIIGIVLGIQFMTSNAEDKAKVKQALIAYAAGCGVVFGSLGIWKIAIMVLSSV